MENVQRAGTGINTDRKTFATQNRAAMLGGKFCSGRVALRGQFFGRSFLSHFRQSASSKSQHIAVNSPGFAPFCHQPSTLNLNKIRTNRLFSNSQFADQSLCVSYANMCHCIHRSDGYHHTLHRHARMSNSSNFWSNLLLSNSYRSTNLLESIRHLNLMNHNTKFPRTRVPSVIKHPSHKLCQNICESRISTLIYVKDTSVTDATYLYRDDTDNLVTFLGYNPTPMCCTVNLKIIWRSFGVYEFGA
ncbi:hypothetical protein TOT_010000419 [Theileria orientalis strain Shintoku]|uniref:Uncharacterized protein n=1 Tax=Theileria orientalis strain Shintoku TaxID=869250 RepID=J4DNH2_THEOR|nr:LOW QUALITY PROTEIN: hypothetical protein TOT_010000419 [Theileria orientalis strain Shintoku]BAM38954.1 hypothetical protein TOT_010000419 [Theileria orientalis strain Shintoku]|eukprot:XP_009689255.1 LOW QUALITY PROTEIN: hypothetical protein TOT_010000419 [Theileria orientalis strain Shintoku]